MFAKYVSACVLYIDWKLWRCSCLLEPCNHVILKNMVFYINSNNVDNSKTDTKNDKEL